MILRFRPILAALVCSVITTACNALGSSFGQSVGNLQPPISNDPQVPQIRTATEFRIFDLDQRSDATAVATGPTGDVWFTDTRTSQIGRITTDGAVTEYKTPTRFSKPFDIVRGPDDDMWFTESSFARIGRITADGSVTEFHPSHFSYVDKICVGPDGALWFTGGYNGSAQVGRMTLQGKSTYFSIPASVWGITTGPDDNLWVSGGNSVFRVTVAGSVTQYKTKFDAFVGDIIAGPDGKLWFWLYRRSAGYEIGRLTTVGVLKEYPLGPSHVITDIFSASGEVWYSLGASAGAGVASITENGSSTEYLQAQCGQAYGLTQAGDGNLWFTCYSSMDALIRYNPASF